jgi:hypothetical protein
MKGPLPTVVYRKPVSDVSLKLLLERIATLLGVTITVHSGDRDYRPKGSPSKSLHLKHRAADLHVSGIADRVAFDRLRTRRRDFNELAINRFQVIYHGPHTETEAEHIHIGDYALIKAMVLGTGVTFLTEGTTPATKGKYTVVT